MDFRLRRVPEIIRVFFLEPTVGGLFSTMLGRNRDYAHRLAVDAEKHKDSLREALKAIKSGLPEEPNGSFAYSHILQASVDVLGEEGAPLFAEMLVYPWVLRDRQLCFILLGGVRLGGKENIRAVQEFCRQIILQGEKELSKNLLAQAGKTMKDCALRGFSDVGLSEVAVKG